MPYNTLLDAAILHAHLNDPDWVIVDRRFNLADTGAGRSSTRVVHMCGSGVTACHKLLAMEIAGLTGSRLYTESWNEWIRGPARPVATGQA
jgi:hypothetical protein